ncbi:TIGR03943 family protein [Streptomyces sp. V3I7]|uniref:TIGR03943 family putative permease subunit n=1 Tax=Streptomyces sp. V3I7 TaxID=3042278 RepID=UPI00278AE9D1|nr:TIGR03943 family protein [Streptomyces sp. V3I7]MDQ0992100.1 putative repeat protein (TIGR03943 family) [Streptomyces sp. V3I7]
MNRQAQAAVLLLTGAALLHAGLTDLYLRYVKAGLRPLLLTAGAALIVTALATAWYEWRGAGGRRQPQPKNAEFEPVPEPEFEPEREPESEPEREPESEPEFEPEHGHEPRIAWLLVLPLLALILVAPPALGSYSALRAGTGLQQQPYEYGKLSHRDPVPLSLADYAGRAAFDHGRSLDGRHVRVTGFVVVDRTGAPYLVRMALNCCAADAQPVKIGLTGRIPPVLRPDAWLEVTGTYTARQTRDPVNDGRIPFLRVTSSRPVPEPHDPYDETWNN